MVPMLAACRYIFVTWKERILCAPRAVVPAVHAVGALHGSASDNILHSGTSTTHTADCSSRVSADIAHTASMLIEAARIAHYFIFINKLMLYNKKTKRWIQDTPANRRRLGLKPKRSKSATRKKAPPPWRSGWLKNSATGRWIKATPESRRRVHAATGKWPRTYKTKPKRSR